MAEFVGPAIEVVKCIAEPIKRQFNYLCCFNTNIQNLEKEAKNLDNTKVGMDEQVAAARRNNKVIVPGVETWLDDVNEIQAEMNAIEPEIRNLKSGCLAIMSRFSLSKKATKMAETMKNLQDEHGKVGEIALPALPAAMAPSIPLGQTYELESRKHFEEGIMATLREKKVRMMGICGMGGVGKTTMAKKIMSRASRERGEGLFDEIVIVVVSQPVDMSRIQNEMAELLGLKLQVNGAFARAHELQKRLMNSKSILIILDDLWENLNLENLGIPDQKDLKDCTILLTSRNADVLGAMKVEKTFKMINLKAEEAWSLFKEKVGACADDPNLLSTAQHIVQECKGLPLALVTVGGALKDETNKAIWENSLQELKSSNPDIQDFLEEVYNPLKLSYDLLKSEPTKLIFLMCCLFPEDHEISISHLSFYAWGLRKFDAWGLRVFEGIKSLWDMRNKVEASVKKLKNRSLLLDCRYTRYTKMHDIVRDVGIFIAKKEGFIDPNLNWPGEESNYNVTWISLFHQQTADKFTLARGSVFPNLHFFLIQGPYSVFGATAELSVCDNFFESVGKLHVLSIHYYKLRSLPHTIQLLENIKTLIFYRCDSLEDISAVGQLTSLEILYCHFCDSIMELPVEIGRLNKLKLLHFSYCRSLSRIAAGVISSLTTLEELTLMESFSEWEWGGSEGKNAALCEINSLSNLTTLKIQIQDASLANEQIHLSSNLVEFYVGIGKRVGGIYIGRRDMSLQLEKEVIIGDWIHQLLRTTERLYLKGEGSSKLLPFLPEYLDSKLTGSSDGRSSGTTTAFPLLEFLYLSNIDINSLESFNNLSSIKIDNCRSLRSLFPWAMGNNYLLRLKRLEIKHCPMLEQVMFWDIGQNSCDHRPVPFPELVYLFLEDLPRLTNLCKGIDNTEFPALTRMEIVQCPNLKSLVSGAIEDHDDDDSLHLICKTKASLGRLEYLTIDGYDSISSLWCVQIPVDFFTRLDDLTVRDCGNIKSLFSPSIAGNLVNLTKLNIKSCSEMVKVIEGEDVERSLFIKLKVLRLKNLPKLMAFCNWRCVLELPSLQEVYISECPEMERFSFGSLITPDLERISIDWEDISDYTKDLNDAVFGGNFLHLEILFGSD